MDAVGFTLAGMGQETVTELEPASVYPFFVAVVRVMLTLVPLGA